MSAEGRRMVARRQVACQGPVCALCFQVMLPSTIKVVHSSTSQHCQGRYMQQGRLSALSTSSTSSTILQTIQYLHAASRRPPTSPHCLILDRIAAQIAAQCLRRLFPRVQVVRCARVRSILRLNTLSRTESAASLSFHPIKG